MIRLEQCAGLGRDPKTITRTRLGSLVLATSHEDAEAKRNEVLARQGLKWDSLPGAGEVLGKVLH